jgi:hypothetical protein
MTTTDIPDDNDSHTVTFFPNKQAASLQLAQTTLPLLAELIGTTQGAEKFRLPWLKLARFGDKRSDKNCLRTDANTQAISGCEVEHDAGTITFETAVALMQAAGIRCLLYTSPSWQEGVKEKWRILLPTSKELPGEARFQLVARAHGLLGEGAITPECFTLSQAYLFGHLKGAEHREVVIEGDFIDQRGDLDANALGKPKFIKPAHAGKGGHISPCRSDEEIMELLRQSVLLTRYGDKQWHNVMLSATASMIGRGWSDEAIYDATAEYCDAGWGDPDIEVMIEGGRAKWNRPDTSGLNNGFGDALRGLLGDNYSTILDAPVSPAPPAPPIGGGNEVPAHLLEVPGLVGKIMRFIVDSAIQPQPILALGSALVIVGTAAGRLLAGPTMSGTHLYTVGLAESGGGKDHPTRMITIILNAAGLSELIGASQFISMPSILNFLQRKPLSACPIDEIGSFLKRINNRHAGEFTTSISGVLRTAWGASYSPMPTPEWAGRSSVIIHAPAMSIYGVSTPEEFYAALEGADILNGALNRFILLVTKMVPPKCKPQVTFDQVPQEIIDGLLKIYNTVPATAAAKQGGTLLVHPRVAAKSTVAPIYDVLTFTPEAEQIKNALDDEIAAKQQADKKLRPFLARTTENAIRLATIRAIGRERIVVDEADMIWARDFMLWSTYRLAEGAGLYISDTEPQAIANAVKRALKDQGRVSRSALVKTLQHKYRASDLAGVLGLLITSGEVEVEEVPQPPGKAGRPGIWYTFRG